MAAPKILSARVASYHPLREWSGTEIVILSERLQYLVTRRRGSDGYQEIYNFLKLHLRMRRRVIDFFFQDNN